MFTLNSADIEFWLSSFIWPFIRVLALFTAAPVFSHRAFPRRARIGLALMITLIISPFLEVAPTAALFSPNGLLLLLQQLFIGLAIGFSTRLIFSAIEAAGDLIGLQMGLSFATFIDPQHNQQLPIIGSFLGILASLVFFATNGHLILLTALVDSFQTAPIALDGFQKLSVESIFAQGAIIFSLGLHLALPMIAAIMIANIALGLLSRAAPQLNIFAIGFPLTLMVGFWSLWLALPYLGNVMERILSQATVEFIR